MKIFLNIISVILLIVGFILTIGVMDNAHQGESFLVPGIVFFLSGLITLIVLIMKKKDEDDD